MRPLLTSAFDKFGDWMGAYVVAEILGDRYADEAALAALEDLSSNAETPAARELAAYGLGRLARAVPEGPLHARALDRLNVLASNRPRSETKGLGRSSSTCDTSPSKNWPG